MSAAADDSRVAGAGRVSLRRPPPQKRRAGYWRRLVAAGVDAALSAVGVWLIWHHAFTPPWELSADPELFRFERIAVSLAERPGAWASAWLLLHVPWGLLQATFAVAERETPGMWVAGVTLVDRQGESAEAGRRMLRAAAWWLVPASLYLLGLWIVASRSYRGVHDRLSGVWAVRR